MSKIYYGVGKVPKGKVAATEKQAIKKGEIRRWGQYKINPKLLHKANLVKINKISEDYTTFYEKTYPILRDKGYSNTQADEIISSYFDYLNPVEYSLEGQEYLKSKIPIKDIFTEEALTPATKGFRKKLSTINKDIYSQSTTESGWLTTERQPTSLTLTETTEQPIQKPIKNLNLETTEEVEYDELVGNIHQVDPIMEIGEQEELYEIEPSMLEEEAIESQVEEEKEIPVEIPVEKPMEIKLIDLTKIDNLHTKDIRDALLLISHANSIEEKKLAIKNFNVLSDLYNYNIAISSKRRPSNRGDVNVIKQKDFFNDKNNILKGLAYHIKQIKNPEKYIEI